MDVIETLELDRWAGPVSSELQQRALEALEQGKVVYFPHLPFTLREAETALLSANLSSGRTKNISFDAATGQVEGTIAGSAETTLLHDMLERFATSSTGLVKALFPGYTRGLQMGRTSYRPVEIAGRKSASPSTDDKLLHVDAFPTRPTHGRRILRVFANIHPAKPRVWHVGEPFEAYARKFAGTVRRPLPFEPSLLAAFGITRGRRSAYDHVMLGLHDNGKLDQNYQQHAPQIEFAFPPGTSWLCYTDQVLHAAMSGQFALEQTFHVDIAAMGHPDWAPLRVLERVTGRALV